MVSVCVLWGHMNPAQPAALTHPGAGRIQDPSQFVLYWCHILNPWAFQYLLHPGVLLGTTPDRDTQQELLRPPACHCWIWPPASLTARIQLPSASRPEQH